MRNVIFTTLVICVSVSVVKAQEIKLNQLGFYPDAEKLAVVPEAGAGSFEVVSTDGTITYYTGTLGASNLWSHSGENVRIADFSSFNIPGSYKLVVTGVGESHEFIISPDVHDGLARAALKSFFFQRASTSISATHGGIYARNAGHPDDVVYIHESAATASRPEGTQISASKGWYDAGDYNKYVVNSGISTYTLMSAYETFPVYFDSLELNIPESGNGVPDILDEAKWNLDWLLAMQDPNDGGVYHKLTTTGFSGFVMPEDATNTRYVVQKSTGATYDFAAMMAVAYRIYREYEDEFPGFADQCLNAAIDAWEWGQANPGVFYDQADHNTNYDPNVSTGEYGDWSFADEENWAAAELYIATKADSFYTDHFNEFDAANIPNWQDVSALPWISLYNNLDSLTAVANAATINLRITNAATSYRDEYQSSAYRIAMGNNNWDFVWGSNGGAGNQGMMLVHAYRVSGDSSYLNAALSNLDYLIGRNPTGYSFVAGYGDETPMNFHHRVSSADGIAEPVPGLIAGGPQPGQEDNCSGYPSNDRATSYLDSECSYSTNEVTINWNAPLVFLSGAIENYFGEAPDIAPLITNHPDDLAVAEGGSASFTVAATGQDTLTYQWQFNGVNIPGADSIVLAIASVTPADTGAYRVIVTNNLGADTSNVATLSILVQGPYNGTPIDIPGIVEAEDFDEGGEGLAYHDSDPGNQGGDYRNEAVDISGTGDSGGGYNVGWVSDGEWLEYTVDVDSSAYYFFRFRVGTFIAGGLIDVYFDSVQVINNVYVASTGSWVDYENVYVDSVFLNEGEQIMQLFFENGPVNINFVDVSSEPFDCNGEGGGEAYVDSCGVCAEGSTGVSAQLDPDNCTVSIDVMESIDVVIYPNPSEGEFNLKSDQQIWGVTQVIVLDVFGQELEKFQLTDGLSSLAFGKNYNPGFYLVKIVSGSNVFSHTIVKQ